MKIPGANSGALQKSCRSGFRPRFIQAIAGLTRSYTQTSRPELRGSGPGVNERGWTQIVYDGKYSR
jgi:hypothetical protein